MGTQHPFSDFYTKPQGNKGHSDKEYTVTWPLFFSVLAWLPMKRTENPRVSVSASSSPHPHPSLCHHSQSGKDRKIQTRYVLDIWPGLLSFPRIYEMLSITCLLITILCPIYHTLWFPRGMLLKSFNLRVLRGAAQAGEPGN